MVQRRNSIRHCCAICPFFKIFKVSFTEWVALSFREPPWGSSWEKSCQSSISNLLQFSSPLLIFFSFPPSFSFPLFLTSLYFHPIFRPNLPPFWDPRFTIISHKGDEEKKYNPVREVFAGFPRHFIAFTPSKVFLEIICPPNWESAPCIHFKLWAPGAYTTLLLHASLAKPFFSRSVNHQSSPRNRKAPWTPPFSIVTYCGSNLSITSLESFSSIWDVSAARPGQFLIFSKRGWENSTLPFRNTWPCPFSCYRKI